HVVSRGIGVNDVQFEAAPPIAPGSALTLFAPASLCRTLLESGFFNGKALQLAAALDLLTQPHRHHAASRPSLPIRTAVLGGNLAALQSMRPAWRSTSSRSRGGRQTLQLRYLILQCFPLARHEPTD